MYKVYWKLAVAAWLLVSTVASHDPGVTHPAPSVASADPSVASADPSATPADSSAAPADSSAAPADSRASHTDPDQASAAIVGSIQRLLGAVIFHKQNAEALRKGIYAQLEDIASRQKAMISQQEDIISRLESVETWQNNTTETLASVAAEARILVPPRDCSDLPPGSPSGVYQIRLTSAVDPAIDAFCNQTIAEGGWTVFQRRADIQPRQNFFLTWEDYKFGFGNMDGGEFWWGLGKLARLTSSLDRKFQLRIDLEDEDGNWGYAAYNNFRISSEADGYRLHASNFRGDVGDGLGYNSGQKFSTKDRDQDKWYGNCAQDYEGAWWYSKCAFSQLNSRYKPGTTGDTVVYWRHWKNRKCLKTVEMKLRPV